LQYPPTFAQIGIFGFENIPSGNPGPDTETIMLGDQGDQTRLLKKRPKCGQTNLLSKFINLNYGNI
jgi:hypothetical protein